MKLEIAVTDKTPQVLFDTETETYLIKGRCLTQRSMTFFEPLTLWLKKNLPANCKKSVIQIMLDYCNTESFIGLMKLFNTCELLNTEYGCGISIDWYYDAMDEDWMEEGKGFEEVCELTFNFIAVKN